jgi:septum site-determining protein MinC
MAYASMENAIILKGTRHGLLASVREDADWREVLRELASLTVQNPEFLKDAQLVLDFGWREITEEQFDAILQVMTAHALGCNGILSTSLNTRTIAESRGYRAIIGRLGLAQHQGRRLRRDQEAAQPQTAALATAAAKATPAQGPPNTATVQQQTPHGSPAQPAAPHGSPCQPAALPAAPAQPAVLSAAPSQPAPLPAALVPARTSGPLATHIAGSGPQPPTPELVPAAPSVPVPGPVSLPAQPAPAAVPAVEAPLPAAPPAPALRGAEESLEDIPSEEPSLDESSAFDSADPLIASLPVAFDSSEAEGPRNYSSSHEPGIHIPHYQDEEPTLYIRKTLRSGQRVVFAGNVVLLGDLNPGAQIEADGDVIVLGQLRGSVHAGCEGDEEATVVTSSMRATQLRIADRFYKAEAGNRFFRKTPPTGTLRARLDGDTVVVEALPVR